MPEMGAGKFPNVKTDGIYFDRENLDLYLSRLAAGVLGLATGDYFAADRLYLDSANQDNYISRLSATHLLLSGGLKLNNTLHMNSKKITNLLDPTAAQDGATKTYVDTAIDTDVATHAADPDAHHSEEIAHGRGYYGTTTLLSLPSVIGVSMATLAAAADRIHYFPIKVDTPITVDRFVIEVTVAGGAGEKCRCGLYKADTDWQPTDLVVDSGEMAIDSTAVVTATINQTLQEGRYLLALHCGDSATFRALKGCSGMIGWNATLGASAFINVLYVGKTYGAYADPGTAWDSISTASSQMLYPVFLRVSTP